MIGYGFRVAPAELFGDTPRARALRENSYQVRLEREIEASRDLPTEFMQAYLESYKTHGFPNLRRTLHRLIGCAAEGNGDPIKVAAYRQVLEDRLKLD